MALRTRSATVASLLFAAAVWSLVGCGGLNIREQELFDLGRTALDSGRLLDARGALDELVNLRPEFAPARLYRAEVCLHLGELETAWGDLDASSNNGAWSREEAAHGHYLRGRCLVEKGRRLVDDSAFRARAAPPDLARRSRERFMAANVSFSETIKRDPKHADAMTWRAYSLYRQENHRGALEALRDCESLAKGDWRHRFFRVLAWDGLRGLNVESAEEVLQLVLESPNPDRLAVVSFLIDLHDEVPESLARRIERVVEAYRVGTTEPSEMVDAFLAKVETDRLAREHAAALERALARARQLAKDEHFADALAELDGFLEESGGHTDAEELRRSLAERWSRRLEVQAAPLLENRSEPRLIEALESYRSALDLTEDLDRRIGLEKKVTMVEQLLGQIRLAGDLDEAVALADAGRHQEALRLLDTIPKKRLDQENRDRYHFTRGRSQFHLGEWQKASSELARVLRTEGDAFARYELIYGMSLLKSGRRLEGLRLLEKAPGEHRDDDVNRLVAAHLVKNGRHHDALHFIEAIESPQPADVQLEASSHKQIGIDRFQSRDYTRAAEHLGRAAELFHGELGRAPVETLAYLGKAFHRSGEPQKANKAFERFVAAKPSMADQQRFRDVYLTLGRIRHQDGDSEAAFKALERYRSLGGTLPPEVETIHARLFAAYSDYLPLAKISLWRYEKSASDGDVRFEVKVASRHEGVYRVEQREDGLVLAEEWRLEDGILVRKSGDVEFRLPVRVLPSATELPSIEYESGGHLCRAAIVAFAETVELDGNRRYLNCLRVEASRELTVEGGDPRRVLQRVWLAPDVGEVKREVVENGKTIATIRLLEATPSEEAAARESE